VGDVGGRASTAAAAVAEAEAEALGGAGPGCPPPGRLYGLDNGCSGAAPGAAPGAAGSCSDPTLPMARVYLRLLAEAQAEAAGLKRRVWELTAEVARLRGEPAPAAGGTATGGTATGGTATGGAAAGGAAAGCGGSDPEGHENLEATMAATMAATVGATMGPEGSTKGASGEDAVAPSNPFASTFPGPSTVGGLPVDMPGFLAGFGGKENAVNGAALNLRSSVGGGLGRTLDAGVGGAAVPGTEHLVMQHAARQALLRRQYDVLRSQLAAARGSADFFGRHASMQAYTTLAGVEAELQGDPRRPRPLSMEEALRRVDAGLGPAL